MLLTALLLFAHSVGLAQAPEGLVPGARIRVVTRDRPSPTTATLVRLSRDSMWLRTERGQPLTASQGAPPSGQAGEAAGIPLSALRGLEVSMGRRTQGAAVARGAGIGLLVGAGIGGAIGALTYDPNEASFFCHDRSCSMLWGAGTLGVLGAVVGTVAGAIAPGERWKRVRLPVR